MKDTVIYWLVFFHITKFRLSCCVGEDAKLKFVDRYVNMSFLKFGFLRHRKLHGHVYLACE